LRTVCEVPRREEGPFPEEALAQDMRHASANVQRLVAPLSTTPDHGLDQPRPAATAEDDLSPFPSLESAQEYINLLGTAVEDAIGDIQQDIEAAGTEHAERRLEALHLVNYKLGRLRHQVDATGRLLNDLRTLRRLLLGERRPKAAKSSAAKPLRS
jgi:hypothetical protein